MSESVTSDLDDEFKCIVKVDGHRYCKTIRASDVSGRRPEDFDPPILARMCTRHGNKLMEGSQFDFMVEVGPELFSKAHPETAPSENLPSPAYQNNDQSMDLNPASPIANLRETNLTTSWHNGEEGEAQEYQLGMLPRQFLESNDRVAGAYESLQAKLETVAESQQESEKRLTDNLQVVLDTLGDLSKAVAVISQKLAEPDQRPATNSRDVAKILQEISDQMKKGFTAISTQVQKTIQQQASSEAVQNRSEMGRLVEQVKKVELTMQTRGLAEAEASKSRSKGRQQLIEQLHQQSQLIDSRTSDFVDECLPGR